MKSTVTSRVVLLNLAHLALSFFPHLLLSRFFSFRNAQFNYAPSPMTPSLYAQSSFALIFIPCILLRRLKNEEGAERKCNC
jgi:hypothetical protein